MLNKIGMADAVSRNYNLSAKNNVQKTQNNATNVVSFSGYKQASADKLAAAYRGYNNINMASTVSFTGGGSLFTAFNELNQSMVTCKDEAHGKGGEKVGSRIDVSKLLSQFEDDLPNFDDAIKTTIPIAQDGSTITDARTQIKKGRGDDIKFEMVVRPSRSIDAPDPGRIKEFSQLLGFELDPYGIKLDADNKRSIKGTKENAYVLNTKGKLMAVVEDGENVLLTNAGDITKKDGSTGKLKIHTVQNQNEFKPFEVTDVPEVREKSGGSQGGGSELVIGLESGRFVPEIIDSIETFVEKVDKGEIVLDEFVPAEGAENMQLSMLAGGFGSRAEYTNASSSKIIHDNPNGSNLTKGCFRTATGLTPMETTFISLHKAGLLDCSKGNLGIGKNIKFYLNDSNVNGGNGGFTVDMYDTMKPEDKERKSLLILPNDAMSRIPEALKQATEKMNSGKAAMVMIAKEVAPETARGSLGIMQINENGEIQAFAEKPKKIKDEYVVNGNCLANTFQFAVSKEAFEALDALEEFLPGNDTGKEPRDWSKTFTPILMALTRNDDTDEMYDQIKSSVGLEIPESKLAEAKAILGDQKIYAIGTSEPWADCGTLNALYHTTMEIASGAFPLEDFERKHVLDSVNTKTGLVASSPEQKEEIEDKYDIKGQVMVVPKAKVVSDKIVDKYAEVPGAIKRYSEAH